MTGRGPRRSGPLFAAAQLALLMALAACPAGCGGYGPLATTDPSLDATVTVSMPTAAPPAATVAAPTLQTTPAMSAPTPATGVRQTLAGEPERLFSETFAEGLTRWEAGDGVALDPEGRTDGTAVRLADGAIRTSLDTAPGSRYKVAFWVQVISQRGTDWGRIPRHGRVMGLGDLGR